MSDTLWNLHNLLEILVKFIGISKNPLNPFQLSWAQFSGILIAIITVIGFQLILYGKESYGHITKCHILYIFCNSWNIVQRLLNQQIEKKTNI